ncbi:LysM peptidoglycan-binding domain-containing protein, partial [Treponema pedis]|uniref:LysM peptidoglycan-binding domain-containing protein n=1 Tax=Treponema pedis TaxID=409322 RepID=UPI001CEF9099
YNVSVSVILETNKIKDASKIKAGQKLIIPQEKKSGKTTEKTDTEKNTALKTVLISFKKETPFSVWQKNSELIFRNF